MFGYTKAGKTSSCHIMANSPLKADKLNGELVYRTASQKFNTAIIGNSSESETEIPNIFEGKFKDSKGTFKTVTILDQPGYGDSYGFHRIFSNGYFHYRTFSKTPKLKFILAIKKDGLDGTGQLFKNTLFNFISTFTNYAKIKN
jgi:hypothetical protein